MSELEQNLGQNSGGQKLRVRRVTDIEEVRTLVIPRPHLSEKSQERLYK